MKQHKKFFGSDGLEYALSEPPLKKRVTVSFQKYWLIYLLILPGVVSLIVFAYGPMLLQFIMSFTDYRLIDGIFGLSLIHI